MTTIQSNLDIASPLANSIMNAGSKAGQLPSIGAAAATNVSVNQGFAAAHASGSSVFSAYQDAVVKGAEAINLIATAFEDADQAIGSSWHK